MDEAQPVKTSLRLMGRIRMMKRPVNKLVRDHIPSICERNGQIPETKVLDAEQYTAALNEKLQEEVREYLTCNDLEELADILEVVEALAESQGSALREVMEIKAKKQNTNGAFRNRIFLLSVDDGTL